MAKLKSTFPNMLLSLTLIALVAAAALAGIFMLTKSPIEQAKVAKQQSAIMQVLPEVEGEIRIAEAEESNGVTLHKAYVGEKWIGTAVEASTEGNQNMPFGGTFRLMVGFDNVGNVVKYVVLEQAETPGLGALMSTWFCNPDKPKSNILGKNPATTNFSVSKDGGDVDAITASTITSRAFLEVVVKAYNGIAQQPMPIEATSGASQVVE
jgi:electron transport complex protein RnfG